MHPGRGAAEPGPTLSESKGEGAAPSEAPMAALPAEGFRPQLMKIIIETSSTPLDEERVSGNPPQGLSGQSVAYLRVWALRAGRRVRQPRHQPHGALPQPGDARPGQLLFVHVPSLLGHHHDSAQYLRAVHRAGLPDA